MAETRRAVVIGINDYDDPKTNLSGAVKDAEEIYDILKEHGGFTINEKKHRLLNRQATCENIRAAISDLFWKTDDKCDVALFYFAGHGIRDHFGYGYLLPQDANCAEPFVKGIKIQELKDLFLHSKLRTTGIMILDCCYSGIATDTRGPEALSGDPTAKERVESYYQDLKLHEDLKLPDTAEGRFILASADANKTAREVELKHALGGEKHPHGLYSFHLIEGLRGGLTGASKKEYGRVSLGALIEHLETAFPGDGEHQPRQYCVGTGVHSIILTTNGPELEEELGKRCAQVRDLLSEKKAANVITAIGRLDELVRQRLQRPEIDQCYADAQDALEALLPGGPYRWWAANYDEILCGIKANRINNTRWLDLLDKVMTNFLIDNIRDLDRNGRMLVRQVIDVIINGDSHQNVVSYISRMDRDDRFQSGSEPIGGQKARRR
jgi:hypothetical protein